MTREISIAGDLCVHFGDEWAFGKMSRKTWIERVKSTFFGTSVAFSSFVAEKKSEVRGNINNRLVPMYEFLRCFYVAASTPQLFTRSSGLCPGDGQKDGDRAKHGYIHHFAP